MARSGNSGDGEAKHQLDQLRRETETIGGRALQAATPATADDRPIDRAVDSCDSWGRRIGRTLGWIVMAFLLLQLLRNWGP